MKKNQIRVKRLQNNTETLFTIKNNKVYDIYGKNPVYCSCTGNTVETATPMEYSEEEGVFCPNCHEKKVEILQTYEEYRLEKEAEEKARNEKNLANLHMVEMGSDWECGFKFYGLSANIEYDDWLKVKDYFRYYKKGWSSGQEFEWEYGEPNGWLTRNPEEVERILVDAGLIKSENTMNTIQKREQEEKEKKEEKWKIKLAKRKEIKEKMDNINKEIKEAFDIPEKRILSDAEANEHYFKADFKGNVHTYRIFNNEIIMCDYMGDYKYGVAIPFSQYVKQLIENYYYYNKQMWE